MHKSVSIALMCVFIICLLTACYDGREIDEWAYVYTIGVDKGVSNVLRFTFQIPSLKRDGGGGGSSGGTESQSAGHFTIISLDAPTFHSGVDMAETSFSRKLNYMHANYLLISEELAREGVERFINGMIRSRQIRHSMYIIIVRGKASDYIEEFNPVLTGAISKAQDGFMKISNKDDGLTISTNYHNFISDLKTAYRTPVVPLTAINDFSNYEASGAPPEIFKSEGDYYAGELPRSGGNKFEFFGTALFEGDKMVGALNGDETRAMLMVRGEFNRGSIAMTDPKDKKLRITINASQQKKPGIKATFIEGKPVINVKIFLEGNIQNTQSSTEYESVKLKPVLENAFREYVKGILDRTISKCKNLNVDAFGFGEKVVMHFLTIQEWEKYNWLGRFKDTEVTTEVKFIIRRTGTMLKTNPIQHSNGEK
ncbi:MAG: Ger(x)C family spore germination protein [Ruminiclostridium sp.]|nr:Ger(x)C family spore germination protein [Ruminiclostridium sp.]